MPLPSLPGVLSLSLPAIACGNLLWLNLALAPAVFGGHVAEPTHERSGEREELAPPASDGDKQVKQRVAAAERPSRSESARDVASPPASPPGSPPGRCEASEFHNAVAFLRFETNSERLRAASLTALDVIAERVAAEPSILWVDGHADQRGKIVHNRSLSQRRAQKITDALLDRGVERARIEMRFFGESSPQGRARSRLWKDRQAVICVEKKSL